MFRSFGYWLAQPATRLNLLVLGLTAMFVACFLVWLPGPGVGLQLIGVEIGEWIKFLGVGPRRDLFYLPPIALGLVLGLWTAFWPNNWRAWLARLLAVGAAMLAFPAIAAITLEPRSEWLLRVVLIGTVAAVAVAAAVLAARQPKPWLWLVMAAVAASSAIVPTWQYLAVLPVVRAVLRESIGVGPGVWLNVAGGLLVAAICAVEFQRARQTKTAASAAAVVE